ncbi:MAG: hypothetical protein LBU72_07560 [Burkholderiaceae bacterium]|jgi:hypothetical protein|nr:hypothetical protein [Burkholderiaceae bacterium]
MNCPPPVRFPLGRSPQWGAVLAGVWLLALIPLVTALALHAPARSDILVLLVAFAVCISGTGLALRLWRGQVVGALVWNGAQWFLEKTGKDGATAAIAPPAIRFDGQRWLLLHTRASRRPIWLWIGRSAEPLRWHALRCALYGQVPARPALA